jgi:hypothetical protein
MGLCFQVIVLTLDTDAADKLVPICNLVFLHKEHSAAYVIFILKPSVAFRHKFNFSHVFTFLIASLEIAMLNSEVCKLYALKKKKKILFGDGAHCVDRRLKIAATAIKLKGETIGCIV